jgi:hypothetical protein
VITERTTTATTNAPKTTSKAASAPTIGCATNAEVMPTAPRLKDAGRRGVTAIRDAAVMIGAPPASLSAITGAGDLVSALRGEAARRRAVDPGLAGGLREWLEDGVAGPIASLEPEMTPIVFDSRMLVKMADGTMAGGQAPNLPLLRAAMATALFRQLVTTGHLGDPLVDALEVLATQDRGAELATFASRLTPEELQLLGSQLAEDAATMALRWPRIPPAWLPRTADRLTVPLAGGRAVLVGVADLVLGAPPVDRASVCLVEVRSAAPTEEHRRARTYLSLLEALRSGAPPCRVATYYSGSGVLDAEEPQDEELAILVRDLIATIAERCRTMVEQAA